MLCVFASTIQPAIGEPVFEELDLHIADQQSQTRRDVDQNSEGLLCKIERLFSMPISICGCL